MAGACSTSVGQRDLMETCTGGSAAAPQEQATGLGLQGRVAPVQHTPAGPDSTDGGLCAGERAADEPPSWHLRAEPAPGPLGTPSVSLEPGLRPIALTVRSVPGTGRPSTNLHWLNDCPNTGSREHAGPRGSELASLCSLSTAQGAALR